MFFPGVKADRREAGVNHGTAAGSFKVSVQQACLINAVSTAVPNYKDISQRDGHREAVLQASLKAINTQG